MDELWTKHKLTGGSMRDGLWGRYADRWDDVQAGPNRYGQAEQIRIGMSRQVR